VQPPFGGIGEAAFLGDRNEIAQMPQFHGASHASKVWLEHTKSLSGGQSATIFMREDDA
jgi:hypothetical protein